MLLSELWRAGTGMMKDPRLGRSLTERAGYFWRDFSQYHWCLKHQFSTSATDNNDGEGSKPQEKLSSWELVLVFGRSASCRLWSAALAMNYSDFYYQRRGRKGYKSSCVGMSMILEAAHQNDIDLEGACEGSLACSTCHIIVSDVEYYNKLKEPTDEENDMLDLAFGLTETSRLGCQVTATPEIEGIRLQLPAATRNFAVDGFVPKPH